MAKSPYFEDWLRGIEAMNEEDLIAVIENGDRDEEYLKLARERLAFLRSDNAPKEVWEEKAESAERVIRKSEFDGSIKKEVDNSAESTLSFFAVVTMVVAIIAGLAMFVVAADAPKGESTMLFVFGVSLIIGGLISWATLKVFVNISKTLKEINFRISQK